MNKLHALIMAAFCALALAAAAQDTNMLKTDIGVFESRTGLVIIKAFNFVGAIPVDAVDISVRYKESTEAATGVKTYGILIAIQGKPLPHERIYVDYDEIDSLLDSINCLIKINSDVTTLPAFEASYTTKSGLRIIANSDRRNGTIRNSIQYGDEPRIILTSIQMTQLYDYIAVAKKNLDALKAGK